MPRASSWICPIHLPFHSAQTPTSLVKCSSTLNIQVQRYDPDAIIAAYKADPPEAKRPESRAEKKRKKEEAMAAAAAAGTAGGEGATLAPGGLTGTSLPRGSAKKPVTPRKVGTRRSKRFAGEDEESAAVNAKADAKAGPCGS